MVYLVFQQVLRARPLSCNEAVLVHAVHVLLDEGLELAFHGGLLGHAAGEVGAQHGVALEAVDGLDFLAIVLEQVVATDVLVNAVVIIEGPGGRGGGVGHVATKGEVGLVISQDAHDGGHDARLLHHHVVAHGGCHAAIGGEEGDGDAVHAQVGLILGVGGLVGVVGSYHKEGVLVPWLLCGLLKEVLEGLVGVAHALVDGVVALLGVLLLKLLGHLERVMARGGEHGCQERLFVAIEVAEHETRCGPGIACSLWRGQRPRSPSSRFAHHGRMLSYSPCRRAGVRVRSGRSSTRE